jgi:hypothetical protein
MRLGIGVSGGCWHLWEPGGQARLSGPETAYGLLTVRPGEAPAYGVPQAGTPWLAVGAGTRGKMRHREVTP